MKPVVPKIRVGDVLLGTKNLRSYLRMCSLIRCLRGLEEGSGQTGEEAKSLLYTPGKGDEFVVVANNYDRFCVWGINKDVLLVFVNNTINPTGMCTPRMNGRIFAQWFIHTNDRLPDMSSWPLYAHFTWATMQMNAWLNPECVLRVRYCPAQDERMADSPFLGARKMMNLGTTQDTIANAVAVSLSRGIFRREPSRGIAKPAVTPSKRINTFAPTTNIYNGHAIGPEISDLGILRETLQDLVQKPRILAKAGGLGIDDMAPEVLQALSNAVSPY